VLRDCVHALRHQLFSVHETTSETSRFPYESRRCNGDGAVQLDDRRIGQAGELAVQRGDLRPVAWLVRMEQGTDVARAVVRAPAALSAGISGKECAH
jgi:hypothetical protein